jgi:hypothetical protein
MSNTAYDFTVNTNISLILTDRDNQHECSTLGGMSSLEICLNEGFSTFHVNLMFFNWSTSETATMEIKTYDVNQTLFQIVNVGIIFFTITLNAGDIFV